jgi:hypothetical protein
MQELSSTAAFGSDSATLPYPVNLSITTPKASLARGDWGFKRALPLQSTTKTSTPLIRLHKIDTYEQVTDYASAADHTLTLRKWEEIGVHISTPPRRNSNALGYSEAGKKGERSVFEDMIDSTIKDDGDDKSRDKRWRFNGPWLAGLTDGEFSNYVMKEVRKRKLDFNKLLEKACADAATKESHRIARERDEEVGPAVQPSDLTEQQLMDYIKSLRDDRTELYKLIRQFLDLPPAPNPVLPSGSEWLANMLDKPTGSSVPSIDSRAYQPTSESPYADSGPPSTHPSAGLSYGRSSAHTFNHPLYGPQNKSPPLQARVVMPKGASTGNFAPVLGVGGFVVHVPAGENSFNTRGTSSKHRGGAESVIPGLIAIEPNKVGGSKAYVNPKSASVDTRGRIVLQVEQADPEAVAVMEGDVDKIRRLEVLHTKGFVRRVAPRQGDEYGLNLGGFGGPKEAEKP